MGLLGSGDGERGAGVEGLAGDLSGGVEGAGGAEDGAGGEDGEDNDGV